MPNTRIGSLVIGDGAITRADLNVTGTSGTTIISKIVSAAGTGILINASTGTDAGTGDVSLKVDTTYLDGIYVIPPGTVAQYYRGDKTWQTLNTLAVPELTNLYFTEPRVLSTLLTGYAVGSNTALATTDSILAAFNKTQGQINARAPLASPAFTGTPTAPTAAVTTNTTQIATTAFVNTEIANDAVLKQMGAGAITYYNLAECNYGTGILGTIKITMPKTWIANMLHIEIDVFSYGGSSGASKIIIGGYANNPWTITSVRIVGKLQDNTIRLAHDGTNLCILLGTVTTNWGYLKMSVSKVMVGHGTMTGWGTGWTITNGITDETGITDIVTPPLELMTVGSGTSGYVAYWTGANTQSGESNLFWDAANDRLGIKTAAPTYNLDVAGNFQISGTGTLARFMNISAVTTSNGTTQYSIVNIPTYSPTGPITNLYSIYNAFKADSSAENITTAVGNYNLFTLGAAYTGVVTNVRIFHAANATLSGTGTITNQYGFYAGTLVAGANNYGFYADLDTDAVKVNYALFSNGTAQSFFAGKVGMGGFVNVGVPTAKLHLGGGSTAAASAPLKLVMNTAGGMTTAEDGAFEYFTSNLNFTVGTTRHVLTGRQAQLNGTGFVKASGTTITYDNSVYLTAVGAVTSFSAGTTGLTPATGTVGVVTLAGTLAIANGGSGQITANAALNAFLPAQAGMGGRLLQTDGVNTAWVIISGTGTVTGTGLPGQVSFWDSTVNQAGDDAMFWDNTNKRLGIGTNAPANPLHVVSASGLAQLRLGYDGTFFGTFTVSNAGALTIASFASITTALTTTISGTTTLSGVVRSNSTTVNSNFTWGNTTGIYATAATITQMLFAGATSTQYRVAMRGSVSTVLTAGVSYAGLLIGEQGATRAISGVHGLIAQVVIKPANITTGVGTVTNAATLYIESASIGTGIPTAEANYAIWSGAGNIRFDGLPTYSTGGYKALIRNVTTNLLELTDIAGSGTVTGTGTPGHVAYWDATSNITGESNLFWDATNNRLGIGIATPSMTLTVSGGYLQTGNTTGTYAFLMNTILTSSNTAVFVNLMQNVNILTAATVPNYYGLTAIAALETSTTNITQWQNVYSRIDIGTGYTGTVAAAACFRAGNVNTYGGSTGIITNLYGYFCDGLNKGANNYGFFSNVGPGDDNYNFYAQGSTKNYFGGPIGINTESPVAGVHVVGPTEQIRIDNGTQNGSLFIEPGTGYFHVTGSSFNALVLANAVYVRGGKMGVSIENPTAYLEIAAGTATVPPIKLTAATIIATPQPGAIEYDGTHFYGTIGDNSRWQFDQSGVVSFSAGTTGLTPSSPTTGVITLAGTLAIANGGTGATTALAAINALTAPQTASRFLFSNGTTVSWAQVNLSGAHVTGTLAAARMPALTGAVTSTAGTVATTLATNIVGTTNIINGAVDLATKVTGNLPVANLGSGAGADGTTFWRGDAVWAVPTFTNQTITLTGDVTGSGTTSIVTNIATNAVGPVEFRQSVGKSVVGKPGTGTGDIVDIVAGVTNQSLFYDGTTIAFAKIPVGGLSATGTPSATTYLAGDNTWKTTPLGSITGTGTTGHVAFWSGTSVLTGEAALFWDSGNDRLGISTAAPAAPLHIIKTTEAMRLAYDADSYVKFTPISTGSLEIEPTNSYTISIKNGNLGVAGTTLYTPFSVNVTMTQNNANQQPVSFYTTISPVTTAVTNMYGILNVHTLASSSVNITNWHNVYSRMDFGASYTGALISLFLYRASTPGGTNTVVNQYGFYCDDMLKGTTINAGYVGMVTAGATKYNCYMVGTAQNYFAGPMNMPNSAIDMAGLVAIGAAEVCEQVVIDASGRLKKGSGTTSTSGTTWLNLATKVPSFVWTGTAPSGTLVARYYYAVNNGICTVFFSMSYTVAGGGNGQVSFELPSGMPVPTLPPVPDTVGYMFWGSGGLAINVTTPIMDGSKVVIGRDNTSATSYRVYIMSNTTNARIAFACISYATV